MSSSSPGLEVSQGSHRLRDTVELLSSMRFAIALLTVICIASVIGTVVQQHQPAVNYVNQFGPFWAEVFGKLGLYAVYSAGWFLLILAFLVISTSLCIARHTPKIMAELRTFKEGVRESSLHAFHHKATGSLALSREQSLARVSELLAAGGWRAKAQVRDHGVMVAARQGMANRWGYLAAHGAIVLVCVGGLLDGDLIIKAQMALAGKTSYGGGGSIANVPAQHRLSPSNPAFRGNLFVPEQATAGTAVISLTDGVVLQDLPFGIELKKFSVEYYDTGMPKLFASDIVIHDPDGTTTPATVKVNEPYTYKGITLYQSSFDDGGSKVTLLGRPFGGSGSPLEVRGEVGATTQLVPSAVAAGASSPAQALTLEFAALRVINVENLSRGSEEGATDVRAVDLAGQLDKHLGSGARPTENKQLKNVGPSITYRLRDASGQAREFQNYMLPLEMDGQKFFMAGVRESLDQGFRYLRIPADERGEMDGWLRLKAALSDPSLRAKAARSYAAEVTPANGKPGFGQQMEASTLRTLSLFAGVEKFKGETLAGLPAIQAFLETNVPEAERAKTSDMVIRILGGALFELLNLSREQAGLPVLRPGEESQRFMAQAVISLSDSFAYPAPLIFTLKDFQQVQASVFQVTRSPGKTLVYLGCGLLTLGVFVMLYIRERRMWIWLAGAPDAPRTDVSLALSYTRKTLDNDREFEAVRQALLGQPAAVATASADVPASGESRP